MKSKQKAFIILTPGFAASEADSTCLPMQQQLVRTISEMYPHMDVIILSFQYPYHERMYKWFDATVYSFNGKNKGGIYRLLLRKKINAVLNRLNEEKQIVGLFSFWLNECAWVGKKFGAKNAIPHYCWMLGQDARKKNKYPRKLSVKENELIALSDFLQDEFDRNYGIKPFTVIPPGIQRSQVNHSQRDIDLLGAGSLVPLKQFEIFIEIVAEIKKQVPQVKALLVGEGPEKEKLQESIEQAGLSENIRLTGELPHHEVMKLMQRTKVFLHPSSYEGFSGVCLEALGNGAHVVSFCRPMNNEIEQWHIVSSKLQMKEKLLYLLRQTDIGFKQIDTFPIEATAKKIMTLYHQAM